MFVCSDCEGVTNKRFFFRECCHSLCETCGLKLLFEGNNFLCSYCCECPICGYITDIDAEIYTTEESRRLVEKPL